jgi:two-component system, NtrC family, sensor kinase
VPTDDLNRRILVVDDNSSIHHDFQRILQLDAESGALEQARLALFGDSGVVQACESFEVDYADQGDRMPLPLLI